MKYRVENQLDLFEFHDCEFSLSGFDEKDIVVSVKHLNIHEDAKENPHDRDMEISLANIQFKNIHILSFEPMRAYRVDDDGNWYTDEAQIIFTGRDAEEKFISELEKGFSINCIDIREFGGHTTIEISTTAQKCFFAMFLFSDVIVEWDAYCDKAWYEKHRQYLYEATLLTPNGEENTSLHIVCHEEDIYYQGKLEKAPLVDVGIRYQDRTIWGHGKDYLWIDAFADLQKQLPDGVILKCCLTCHHGNMCPFGNKPGEVFCTKDLTIAAKNDLCNWFNYEENGGEIEKRSRSYADTCENYKHQSFDFYTYNDYLYELEK